jgi:hypothetical protein
VIWAEIAVGALALAVFFFRLNSAPPRWKLAAPLGILAVAVLLTVVVGLQVPPGPARWTGFVLPMLGLSAVLAGEGFFIARWLVARGWPFPRFLPAYLVAHGVVAFVTMAIVTALYGGS